MWGFFVLVALLGTQTVMGGLERVMPGAFAAGDPSDDTINWRQLRPSLVAHGLIPMDGFLAAPSWIGAGKAAIGAGPDVPVLCLCADPHHFAYLHDDFRYLGANAVIVKRLNPNDDVVAAFSPYFESVSPLDILPVSRGGRVVMRLGLYRAKNFQKLFPTVQPR